jgi:hypothetical protein
MKKELESKPGDCMSRHDENTQAFYRLAIEQMREFYKRWFQSKPFCYKPQSSGRDRETE